MILKVGQESLLITEQNDSWRKLLLDLLQSGLGAKLQLGDKVKE